MQCPRVGQNLGRIPLKRRRDHAEEMGNLEANKRARQWPRKTADRLAGVLFAIPLFFLLVDLFDFWWMLARNNRSFSSAHWFILRAVEPIGLLTHAPGVIIGVLFIKH